MTLRRFVPDPVCYEIDGQDVIRSVNEAWLQFAVANGANRLGLDDVLGRCLWDYIPDPDTLALYRMLVGHVRESGRNVGFTYRCDSPDLRRVMRMQVKLLENGWIEFRSVVRRHEERDRAVFFAAATTGAKQFAFRCSLCNRLRFRGEWMEVPDAISEGKILDTDSTLQVAYAICERCGKEISDKCFTRP
jgi:hypothetical protein